MLRSLRAFICCSLVCGCLAPVLPAEPASPAQIETGEVLNGQWRRPDGGYVIQIKTVGEDGQLEAAYFNPRPIRVEAAQWQFGGGTLQLRIRLNDRGYEGAYYLLRYDAATNRLVGEYHPANQQTFAVAFERLLAAPRE